MSFSAAFGAEAILTREQMKQLTGGVAPAEVYHCGCNGGGAAWNYEGTSTPSQQTLNTDIAQNCGSNGATCGWQVCGNPGVTCSGGGNS